ncbi:MAG: PepSY-associated TM helix domain-containing protein [Parahaliea sp.]
MRPDGKAEGPRQSMSWLHTWSSLILGWLLFAIFLTGTLSYFRNEITAWMQPELHASLSNISQPKQVEIAVAALQQRAPDASAWHIRLPNDREISTRINIRLPGEDPTARRGGENHVINTSTGEEITARETRGGNFLYRFHFDLYGLPRPWSRWLVGIATLFMFVAIVSGIITHKKIFKDFFTFRPGKGQRSWLDAHNATAVFALPFHLMITFSGLLLLMYLLMPWGIEQVADDRRQFLMSLSKPTETIKPATNTAVPGQHSEQRRQQTRQQEQGRTRTVIHRTEPAVAMADITSLIKKAQSTWPDNSIAQVSVIAPNTANARVELRADKADSLLTRNTTPTITYNGITGERINDAQETAGTSISTAIFSITTILHEGRSLDLSLRWLLFLSGILGTAMVGTGLVLWSVKRAPQQLKLGYKPFGHRLVEILNITTVAGMPLACATFFWANRFIPVGVEGRPEIEIHLFFTAWFVSLVHAALRPPRQAWIEQLALAALLMLLLPLLNPLTGGHGLITSIRNDQWLIASFDLASLVLAVCLSFSAYKVCKAPLTRQPHKKRTAIATDKSLIADRTA